MASAEHNATHRLLLNESNDIHCCTRIEFEIAPTHMSTHTHSNDVKLERYLGDMSPNNLLLVVINSKWGKLIR